MANALTISGVVVPQPSKMQVEILDISTASRNTQGNMLIDRIATKRKISLEWAQLSNSQTPIILQAVNSVFFQASYPDPYTGTIQTRTFYVGDRSMPVYNYSGAHPVWEGLKMNLIEQ